MFNFNFIPCNGTEKKIKFLYFLTLAGILLWLSGIFLEPHLKSQNSSFAPILYAVYSPTCHQLPSRCFMVFNHPTAVCTRCLGVYGGMLLGALSYPFLNGFSRLAIPKTKTFILISIPIILDTAGNLLNFWATPAWGRFSLGLVWGTVLPYYFISGLADAFFRPKKYLS